MHHLDPLAERERRKSTPDDFVTLCPNCHYLAHFLLRQKKDAGQLKIVETLLTRLKALDRIAE